MPLLTTFPLFFLDTRPCSVFALVVFQWSLKKTSLPIRLKDAQGRSQVLDIFYLSVNRFLRKEEGEKDSRGMILESFGFLT